MNAFRFLALPVLGLAMMSFLRAQALPAVNIQAVNPHTQKTHELVTTSPDATYDPWVGNVTATYAYLGASSSQDRLYNITGFAFGTTVPAAISCQPRQSYNAYAGWPDQFSCQIVSTTATSILVRVRRTDAALGWGQNLRLDFIVFSSLN